MPAILEAGRRAVVVLADHPGYRPRLTTSGSGAVTLTTMTDTTRVPRLFVPVLLAEAATLGLASYLHRDGSIPLGFTTIHGENFQAASLPEAIIGAVLAAGALAVLAAPARTRWAALVATGFAIVGFVVGVSIVLTSGRPSVAGDLTYHGIGLAALLATLIALAWPRQRVRSR